MQSYREYKSFLKGRVSHAYPLHVIHVLKTFYVNIRKGSKEHVMDGLILISLFMC